jgi:mannose-1-phosphate guanylyltransferase
MDRGGPSAILLAGGDGTRLRALTRALTGDDRPKQFCAVLGEDTLLDQTRRRVRMSIDPARTLTVVTRSHERYYRTALAGVPPSLTVVQPENRGTAPAIVYALLRLQALAPDGPVALFPSDHHFSDDRVFMWHVEQALELVAARPHATVLLGIEADRPETEYGWIEPGEPLAGVAVPAYGVRGFREKPDRATAETLLAGGGVWNSFVIVGHPATLLGLCARATPALLEAFAPLRPRLTTPWEAGCAAAVYGALAPVDFSKAVLTRRAVELAVLPVIGVTWSDLGEPGRVATVRRQLTGDRVPAAAALRVAATS